MIVHKRIILFNFVFKWSSDDAAGATCESKQEQQLYDMTKDFKIWDVYENWNFVTVWSFSLPKRHGHRKPKKSA